MEIVPILEQTKEKFSAIVNESGLGEENVQITIGPLAAREAIVSPEREAFAFLDGKEVMIEVPPSSGEALVKLLLINLKAFMAC